MIWKIYNINSKLFRFNFIIIIIHYTLQFIKKTKLLNYNNSSIDVIVCMCVCVVKQVRLYHNNNKQSEWKSYNFYNYKIQYNNELIQNIQSSFIVMIIDHLYNFNL